MKATAEHDHQWSSSNPNCPTCGKVKDAPCPVCTPLWIIDCVWCGGEWVVCPDGPHFTGFRNE